MPSQKISAVLSFRNEEPVLSELIRRLTQTLAASGLDYEIIFVNDASTDGSLSLLKRAASQDRRIKILNMSRRFGVAPCFMAGMEHASGDAVVTLDADLQDPPELIATLIERWQQGADVVYTVRISRKGENLVKIWAAHQAYRLINALSEIKIPADAGDYRLISRRVVQEILRCREKMPYLRGLVPFVGFKQVPVYYHRDRRFVGKTHFPLYSLDPHGPMATLLTAVTSFSNAPLYFFFYLGAAMFLAAFAAGILGLIQWIFHAPSAAVWGAVSLVMGVASLPTTGIGVLGFYFARWQNEISHRPAYIIESSIGWESAGQTPLFTASGNRQVSE